MITQQKINILSYTFQHLKGISVKKEYDLWKKGIGTFGPFLVFFTKFYFKSFMLNDHQSGKKKQVKHKKD